MDALIVASIPKQQHALTDVLYHDEINCIVSSSAAEARRASFTRPFDLFVINGGLIDEHGNELAYDLAESNDCGGILIDDYSRVESLSYDLNRVGVLMLARPISRTALLEAVRLVNASNARVRALKQKNEELASKLEDVKYISRAKILLMRTLGYSEEQAHKYIEKRAMDMRVSRRKVAMEILKTHEAP